MYKHLKVSKLKEMEGGPVGQVFADGKNRFVVVGVTDEGVQVMALCGPITGVNDPDKVFLAEDSIECRPEDREKRKADFPERWDFIAQMYPEING